MSLRRRLLAASLALVAAGLLAADVATYSALRSFLYSRIDQQLEAAQTAVERALFTRPGFLGAAALRQLGAVAPGVFVEVRDSDRSVIVTVEGSGRPEPSADYRERVTALPRGGTVLVALPMDETAATLRQLVLIEALVTLFVLGLAAGGGLWLVRVGLRPLVDIEETADRIAEGDFGQRVTRDDDLTEVGRLGRALNTMLDALHRALDERRESEEAARGSEERMRRFVGDASHELRTPVAAVRAYSELYRLGADERPEDLARLLARIEVEAARMGVLVDDLLLLTRLDEGRALSSAPVDLGAVASDAVDAARAVDPSRPLDFRVEGSVEVRGDRDRLRQVLDNLLSNVRSHTPVGSPASVTVAPNGTYAIVEVADSGPGVAAGHAPHVFERFYRADPARARDEGGAGLGLSIVAAITTAHGGSAEVDQRDGGGATFRIRIPLLRS